MPWTPLTERFNTLPLLLSGPILRRVEPHTVTVWLALKEPHTVTLRVYQCSSEGTLIQRQVGTRHAVRLGDHLYIVAVTARAGVHDEPLAWGGFYYYDLFFQSDDQTATPVSESAAHLATPGILTADSSEASPLRRLVYPGHPLPSFVLPPEDVNQLRIVHGSCRKPHGTGRDMLSALDTLLEASLLEAGNRPQQLFLTGDQIYADDVSAPLLFTLMDVGLSLFAGNKEEVLPLVNTPASSLAPGCRSDIVRNRAMLTTTTPHNHLLALHEYAAMYLLVWSDVLWPDDLPHAQEVWQKYPQVCPRLTDLERLEERYAEDRERLEQFRSALPGVRRALAHTPTYMICDDHEVTDDWFLDGAWCRQVLASPLGHRVLRNALLAYALFQAWGNTTEQFAEQSGATLLNAIDAWRGDESNDWEEKIEAIIGLPKDFYGSGQLQRSEQALQWHYTYRGPRYQVLVMDTRTRRLYGSPGNFPALLSPEAMDTLVASAARREAEINIIISATPILGIDFVESIQFWSRWHIKENYAYDREAWALEWGTFQRLLKTVSVMRRVVFLSGDVHYSFGASLDYWDLQTQTTARLVDYTASPLCNEGSGSQIAVLAVGYPRLLHLLRRDGKASLAFFAWDIPPGDYRLPRQVLTLIRRRLYLFWWAIPRLIAARRSPHEIILPARGWLKGAFRAFPPDHSYRLHYLHNSLAREVPRRRERLLKRLARWLVRLTLPALRVVTFLETTVKSIRSVLLRGTRRVALQPRKVPRPARALVQRTLRGTDRVERKLEKRKNRLVETILHAVALQERWKAGELIVGYNNLGEISFQWTTEKQEVTQRLWWHSYDPKAPLCVTEYHESLEPPALEAAPPLP